MESLIEQCAYKSNAGLSTFPELIAELQKLNVESYHADFRLHTITYYTQDDQTYTSTMPLTEGLIASIFNADALQHAIRAAQRDEIKYPTFKIRAIAAGCTGYFVWIDGRQVTYFGRRGECHIEKFPDNKH